MQENTDEQVAFFSALADPTRLKLVKLLHRQRKQDALCVNALAGLLGVSQSAVSQHLRVLKSIGLVKGGKARLPHPLLRQPGCTGEMSEACLNGSEHRGAGRGATLPGILSRKEGTKCVITLTMAASNIFTIQHRATGITIGVAAVAPDMHRSDFPPGRKSLKNLKST